MCKIPLIGWKNAKFAFSLYRKQHRRWKRGHVDARPLWKNLWDDALYSSIESFDTTLKRSLFRGILSNWREFVFYLQCDKVRRQLLQPTYFSFFGLVNVQRYGKPMKGQSLFSDTIDELYGCFFDVVGPPLNTDSHLFFAAQNFTYVSTRLVRILDYGSLKTQSIVREFGPAIVERFVAPDPSDY